MSLVVIDYIAKATAVLSLCGSIYVLITNFEPKSIIMKLLYVTFVCASIGLALSLGYYFGVEPILARQINSVAELLYDASAVSAALASILRLRELLPIIFIFSSNRKMKMFEIGIKITIGILIFCFVRNIIGRLMGMSNYKTGWVYSLFFSQAALIFYMVCMLSDLVACTWVAACVVIITSKMKEGLRKSVGLVISIILLYIAAILATVAGALSVNGSMDVLDNITASVVVVYYAMVIRVLLEMKKLCAEAFKGNHSTVNGASLQG